MKPLGDLHPKTEVDPYALPYRICLVATRLYSDWDGGQQALHG
jgi:hypothetical protein